MTILAVVSGRMHYVTIDVKGPLMFRTRALALAALASTTFALTACGSDSMTPGGTPTSGSPSALESLTADDALKAMLPDSVKSSGVIKVGIDPTYAPNEFLDTDGKTVKGMDVDIFNAVAAKLGVKVEYIPAGFDTIILGVTSGKFDAGVSSFTINAERQKQVNMIQYFSAGTQWITQTGNPKKVDPENACGLNIGVQKGVVQIDDLKARSDKCVAAGKAAINVGIDPDQGKVTAGVVSGKYDAMLADSPVGLYAAKQTNGQLEAVGNIYDAAPYGFVVAKKETGFADAISKALTAINGSGHYKKALETWGNASGAVTDFPINPIK